METTKLAIMPQEREGEGRGWSGYDEAKAELQAAAYAMHVTGCRGCHIVELEKQLRVGHQ